MADTSTGATTASSTTSPTVSDTGPASGISAGISQGTGLLQALTGLFQTVNGVKLPLTNPLFNYASYDYVLSISAMNIDTYNSAGYTTGRKLPIVCKSANADPSNRIQTAYGSFDFFIDNLELKSLLGSEKGTNTNVQGKFTFTITEPYSMGMFAIALQTAAQNYGHPNWRSAPFLLTIQFRGNTELGIMSNIPGTTRYIPFRFVKLTSKTNQNGTVYQVQAMPYNSEGMSNKHIKLKTDVSIKGITVQEMLQTGEKSLQVAVNSHSLQLVKDKTTAVPHVEYIILFPIPGSASTSPASTTSDGATTASQSVSSQQTLFAQLGVTRDKKSGQLIQTSECNALGKAEMPFSVDNKGNIPVSNDSVVYNKTSKQVIRGNMVVNYKESDFKFTQNSDIPNAINQVLLQSMFPGKTLDATQLTPEGYRNWWRIECVRYITQDNSNLPSTGTLPDIIVYRVVPWKVHGSALVANNTQAPGFTALEKQIVKSYEYIYTGKNVDIINFNIEFNAGYAQKLSADGFKRGQDAQLTGQSSGGPEDVTVPEPGTSPGVTPPTIPGISPDIKEFTNYSFPSDLKGGGGNSTMASRAAMQFNQILNDSTDMVNMDLEIIGDPYYIAHSGTGTYNAKPTQFKNLNLDGSVNHQSGEVDIKVHFRSPLDLNQSTGLYNFATVSKDAPVLQFNGFYQVIYATHRFRSGVFTQVLRLRRRKNQDNPIIATPDQVANTNTPAPGKATYKTDGTVNASDLNGYPDGSM